MADLYQGHDASDQASMAALTIFTAVFAYADLMWPLIANTDLNMMTLSAGLSTERAVHHQLSGADGRLCPGYGSHGDSVSGIPEAVYRRNCNDRRKIEMEIKMENRDG